ncbi:shikimate dehydrogenase [Verrucomicrobium sp. GAS474]|uniref:shikimate dehydrogenase n=1 Tax=Verrucomicrobium sp. GAS474 TaxID=1882831 RepID=UPI00087C1C69|nr:shikimate dehydrogenase [Verrucomicrobium sp. GAS474]SDT93638.1 shikimate dehydrogenase [Verrucomicrobium sp. GAS474]
MAADSPVFTLATLPRPETGEKLYAVIGDPVAHSLSPQMHNAAFAALGLASRYLRIRLAPDELEAGVAKMRDYGYAGWNVTVPHKTALFGLVDQTMPFAEQAGAVNTVDVHGELLVGESTDGLGWCAAMEETFGLRLGGQRIVLVGAGGSAQTLALFLAATQRVSLTIVNRTAARAREIAAKIAALGHCGAPGHGAAACAVAESPEEIALALAGADLIVNTTSLGLKADDAAPVTLPADLTGKYAYDLIYNPAETAFLRAAKAAGARTANGLGMLLWQGVFAFEIWHPKLAPADHVKALPAMRRALEAATGQALPSRQASVSQ